MAPCVWGARDTTGDSRDLWQMGELKIAGPQKPVGPGVIVIWERGPPFPPQGALSSACLLLKQAATMVLFSSWEASSLLADTRHHTDKLQTLFVPSLSSLSTWWDWCSGIFLVTLSPNLLASVISQIMLVLLPLQIIFTFVQEAC